MHGEVEAGAVDSLGSILRRPPRATHRPDACANCGAVLQGDWCHDCGQLAEDFHRSVIRLIMEAVEGLTHLDGRLWRTAPTLLVRPAKLTTDYIEGHRASQIPPLRLFLVVLLLVFLTAPAMRGSKPATYARPPQVVTVTSMSPGQRAKIEAGIDEGTIGLKVGKRKIWDGAAWFKPRLKAALRDPERFKLILESQQERFAFMALPLATLLLCGVFVFQRRFYVFDHTIFALHSLSFQGFLVTAANLLGLAIGGSATILLLLAPVHLFVHMRGVYRTSIIGTLIRMTLLAIGSIIGFAVLMTAMLLVGLSAMTTS